MPNVLNHNELSETPEKEKFRKLSFLKKGTTLERILCFTTVISLLTVAIMAATLAVFGYLYKNKIDLKHENLILPNTDNQPLSGSSVSNLCVTPGCVKAAAALLSVLDETVDPCNDFYKFACGEWLKGKSIPEDKSSMSIYGEIVDTLNVQLRILLEKGLNGTEPSFITKTKEMYDVCIDLETIEETGIEPLQNVLKNLGGWPVIEGRKWSRRNFDWVEALLNLRKLGYNHNILLSLNVIADYRSSKRHIIKLDQTSFGMPDRTYLVKGLNDSSTSAYYKKMVEAATLLGANKAAAEKELLEALQFEMTLANYSLPLEERRNVSKMYNKYTVEQLQETIPQIPWLKYINGIVADEVYENETLIVAVPEFLKKFADLIASKEKRVVANYMFWRVVDQSLPLLSKECREIALEYNKVLKGKRREESRWKQCLSNVRNNLGIALSWYYVRHHFKDETKDEVVRIVKYVYKEFLRMLEEIDWMDEKTKAHAKAKANNMIFYIGYPKELLNYTAVMEHYQNLTIFNDSYFENILRLKKWSADYELSKLRKPNIRRDWKKYAKKAAVVNAFYHNAENIIELPAGYLQKALYDKDRPNYMNFASIGSTIGHEITHGFDDEGRQYDKDGNNVNWWAKTTDELFKKKVQCIIDQYSNYTAENGMQLNGVNTQAENIADNGALKQSYWAYQSWIEDNGPEELLPGLKYNQNQLFWITASYEWCSKYRPEDLKNRILTYFHSPDNFRVTGPMSNLAEFSRDFNCPPDSPMNKKHKCKVW